MKKTIVLLICTVLVLSFASCAKEPDPIIRYPQSGRSEDAEIPAGPYAKRVADWPVYRDAAELVTAADQVFIGRVKHIEFRVLDSTNALPISESTPDYARELYTVYHIEVVTPYKGNAQGNLSVRVMGGMVNHQTEEQLQVMEEGLAFNRERGIPIWEHYAKVQCDIGRSYLFVLRQFDTGAPTILNLDQSVYTLDEPTRKHTIGNSEQVFYTGSVDENGRPLISALDIVSFFGDACVQSFEQNWVSGVYGSFSSDAQS